MWLWRHTLSENFQFVAEGWECLFGSYPSKYGGAGFVIVCETDPTGERNSRNCCDHAIIKFLDSFVCSSRHWLWALFYSMHHRFLFQATPYIMVCVSANLKCFLLIHLLLFHKNQYLWAARLQEWYATFLLQGRNSCPRYYRVLEHILLFQWSLIMGSCLKSDKLRLMYSSQLN